MIYAVEQFKNYKYKVNAVLKRLKKMTILMVIAGIYSYNSVQWSYNNKFFFNGCYTNGSEIIDLLLKYNTYSAEVLK